MNRFAKIAIVVGLFAAVGVAFVLKNGGDSVPPSPSTPQATEGLPRLVDLGAHTCIPCLKMVPILAELRKEYAGRLGVEFIDVWEKPEEGTKYGIRLIPTQIFYDASGKELARHEGFISKEDILSQWAAVGIPLAPGPSATAPVSRE